jgi:glycerol kinase
MNKELYLVIDQGSHASRAIIYDKFGQEMASSVQDISIHQSLKNHVEHDSAELLESVKNTISKAVNQIDKHVSGIKSAGLATQRSSIVCWDSNTGKPLSPVISWQDRRAYKEVQNLKPHEQEIHEKTGLFLTPHYGASKLRWCIDNLPKVREAMENGNLHFGPLAGFLMFNLLENKPHLIDPANGSRTQLYNINSQNWDTELLDLFNIPEKPLPKCVPTIYGFGTLRLGEHPVPLTACTGDQNAAIFAYGQPSKDTAIINIGTGAFTLRLTGKNKITVPRLLTSITLQTSSESTYVLEGTVNGAGSALDWAEKELEINDLTRQLEKWMEEESNPPLFMNGVSGLGSPYWIPDFQSRFIGEGNKKAKAVAVAESILFLIKSNLDEMNEHIEKPKTITLTGGISRNDKLCQYLSNLTNVPVYRPKSCEATARGTAWLAAGMPKEWPEPAKGDNFLPSNNNNIQNRYRKWHKEMKSAISKL